MITLHAAARAKVNLALDVLGKRGDGYHDLKMIMQSVSLCDELELSLREDGLFAVRSDFPRLPGGDRNLALRAARLFLQEAGLDGLGCEIFIRKRIPVCAGLGGGSADAAAVLRVLQEHFGHPLAKERLAELALGLGSDVPFCLLGGTALAEGRGERLTPLGPLPECRLVLATPEEGVSTAAAFAALRPARLRRRPDWPGLLEAVRSRDLAGLSRRLFNVFEEFFSSSRKDLAELRSLLMDEGALGAVMSGTGPTMVGLFDDGRRADAAAGRLAGLCPMVAVVSAEDG